MRKVHGTVATIGVLLLPLGGVSACQAAPNARTQAQVSTAGSGEAANTSRLHGTLSGSRVSLYGSMKDMAKDSTVVVRATAVDTPVVEKIGKVPFTVQTVKVSESFQGSTPGALLKVRQVGDTVVTGGDEFAPLLKTGNEYILFLSPFYLNGKTDQYNATGGAGVFLANADGTASRLDKMSEQLPQKITAATVRQALGNTN